MALAVKWHFKINTSLTHWGWAKWCQSTEIKKKKDLHPPPRSSGRCSNPTPTLQWSQKCLRQQHPPPPQVIMGVAVSMWSKSRVGPLSGPCLTGHELRDPGKSLNWSGSLGNLCTAFEIPLMDPLPLDILRDKLFWNGPGVILVWNPPALISALLKHILCNYSFSFRSGVVGC